MYVLFFLNIFEKVKGIFSEHIFLLSKHYKPSKRRRRGKKEDTSFINRFNVLPAVYRAILHFAELPSRNFVRLLQFHHIFK